MTNSSLCTALKGGHLCLCVRVSPFDPLFPARRRHAAVRGNEEFALTNGNSLSQDEIMEKFGLNPHEGGRLVFWTKKALDHREPI